MFFRNKMLKFAPMEIHFTGVIIAISTFFVIGLFHPIVVKTEYYFGTRPWWLFLIGGLLCVFAALCVENVLASSVLGVIGASFLWSIGELFSQKKRVEKGWFPMNPKRKDQYVKLEDDDSVCPVIKKRHKKQ